MKEIENKGLFTENVQKYIQRISFKKIKSDKDAVFRNLSERLTDNKISHQRGISVYWKYTTFAASVLLLLASVFSAYLFTKEKENNYIDVSAIAGTKSRIVLPDSTVVWLNSNAQLRYPQRFEGKDRSVEFAGEGLFEVKKDIKPFTISIDGLRVKVLGTTFNIHSSSSSDIIEVTLQNGKIALFKNDTDSPTADVVLLPGDQALFNKISKEIEVKKVRASMFSSWSKGHFVFENNTLSDILIILERAFDTKIHLDNQGLENRKFTAQFVNNETLDEILSILQISARYTYKKDKGEIFITGI